MNKNTPHILLVNPWIHDFAAYDFWAKPMGVLFLASILRDHGFKVSYIDCLDRFHQKSGGTDPHARYGRGPYQKTQIEKPHSLQHIHRNYSRYGIMPQWFQEDLHTIYPPDLILVTSLMTYWYTGVIETIEHIRKVFPKIPIILGGIYATLCQDHAELYSGADQVVPGVGENQIIDLVSSHTGYGVKPRFLAHNLDTYPYPGYDLQNQISYIPIMTSRGCPYSCTYCASNKLNPERMVRSPKSIIEEIKFWHLKHKVRDFVFYDDALLADLKGHAIPLLEEIIRTGLTLRFHTPNAIHIRGITKETAGLMKKTGFHTIRLGLETASFKNRKNLDTKVTAIEFRRAADELKHAGFTKSQVGAYLLVGLPGQTLDDITESIKIVKTNHITPIPAYYSPIPHTALWKDAVEISDYDLIADPIFTNNAILPCMGKNFSWKTLTYLKNLVAH